ncbi:MAG: hypothetical protein CK425_01475 [Parachlamydia sp.]|nr:MAG: hypothetical protein CK425_01475 [Parachlamydia sp.]
MHLMGIGSISVCPILIGKKSFNPFLNYKRSIHGKSCFFNNADDFHKKVEDLAEVAKSDYF